MTIVKQFHLLITLKLKKFLQISRLHSFELRFILHVENLDGVVDSLYEKTQLYKKKYYS